jgi:hypothetical protein
MAQTLPYSVTDRAISVFSGGNFKVIPAGHQNFDALRAALLAPDHNEDRILELADLLVFIARQTHGEVQVGDKQVRWRGKPVRGVIVDRILESLRLGYGLDPLANFLDRVMQNPIVAAQEELFQWLESGNAPITPEGKFLAFRNVRADYRDIYSGKFDNSVGEQPSMPREQVDPDRRNTCSRGLHFCSFGYLPSYSNAGSGGHTMIVEVDPADVVAIPTDYNHQKGRTWTYKVVGEVKQDRAAGFYQNHPAVEVVEPTDDEDAAERVVDAEAIVFDLGQIIYCETGYMGVTAGKFYKVLDCDDAVVTVSDDDDEPYEYDAELFRAATEDETIEYKLAHEEEDSEALRAPGLVAAVLIAGAEAAVAAKATPQKPERQFYSKAAKKSFLESEVKALLEEHGQRGMSRLTGVPRTTIQEWIATMNAEAEAEG